MSRKSKLSIKSMAKAYSDKLMLEQKYFSEFKVIDNLNQHPEGLNFKEWLAAYHPNF